MVWKLPVYTIHLHLTVRVHSPAGKSVSRVRVAYPTTTTRRRKSLYGSLLLALPRSRSPPFQVPSNISPVTGPLRYGPAICLSSTGIAGGRAAGRSKTSRARKRRRLSSCKAMLARSMDQRRSLPSLPVCTATTVRITLVATSVSSALVKCRNPLRRRRSL